MSDEKWIPIPTLPHTTFPSLQFGIYLLLTFLLTPIYLPVLLCIYILKCIMYLINKSLYYAVNQNLAPIEAKPENYVVITGAASGIGKEMTLLYAQKGFSVILIDINESVKEFAKDLKQKYSNQHFPTIIADLSTNTAAQDIYNQITQKSGNKDVGNVDGSATAWGIDNVVILVNNAGFGMTGVFLNQSLSAITKMCQVNSIACIQLGHLFGRYFVKRGRGRICQIASIAAYSPGPLAAAYHGTKSMVRSWALGFQHELLGTGVGLSIVCPGPVNTNFANTSHSLKSHVFTTLKWMSYSPLEIATSAVNATLNGTKEVFVGPLVATCHFLFSLYGETYNIIACRFLWANPSSQSRSVYEKFKYKN